MIEYVFYFVKEIRRVLTFRSRLFDLARRQGELEEIFGRTVDLVEREAILRSPNYILRKSILQGARVIYEAQRACRLTVC